MVLFQGWMAHAWWSALCNLSQVGNKLFTSPLEKAPERKEGLFALDDQTDMYAPGTALLHFRCMPLNLELQYGVYNLSTAGTVLALCNPSWWLILPSWLFKLGGAALPFPSLLWAP
jgi:hypothetical protein